MSEERLHPAIAGAQPMHLAEKNPDAPLFEGAYRQRFDDILTRYPEKRAAIIPVLAMAQELRGWISAETIERVGELLDLTPAYVRSVASFYTMFKLQPVGKYLIQVCTSIGCDLCNGHEVLQAFLEATGTRMGEISDDGLYTVIEVECLGACGYATVVQINDQVHEDVKPEDIPGLLEELN